MPMNRRRFVILGGLGLGAAGMAGLRLRSAIGSEENSISTLAPEHEVTTAEALNPQVGAETAVAVGPAGLFAPVRGDVRLAVISDLNSAYGSTDYHSKVIEGVSLLPGWQPDMVLCGGDMVAGQKLTLTEAEIESMWTAFDEKILNPIRTAGLPFALTLGNHDASSYQSEGEFIYVLDRQESEQYWAGHQSDTSLTFVEAAGFPFYYSFKQNDIFYLVWDASSANIAPEQVAWADRALGSEIAQNARLRIVMGHLPMYAVSQRRDRAGEFLNEGAALQALMERHNVHTYISGHHHAYFPGKVGSLDTLHTGALGSGPKSLLNTTTAAFQTLTIMDVFLEQGDVVYTTYNMNTMKVVEPEALPRQVVGPTGRVLREDVEALTPEEMAQPYVPSEA